MATALPFEVRESDIRNLVRIKQQFSLSSDYAALKFALESTLGEARAVALTEYEMLKYRDCDEEHIPLLYEAAAV